MHDRCCARLVAREAQMKFTPDIDMDAIKFKVPLIVYFMAIISLDSCYIGLQMSALLKIFFFLISQLKHKLWVLE